MCRRRAGKEELPDLAQRKVLPSSRGRKEYDSPLAALEAAAKTGNFLSFASMERSLLSAEQQGRRTRYQQSYSMVRFIISSYGWHKVREIR